MVNQAHTVKTPYYSARTSVRRSPDKGFDSLPNCVINQILDDLPADSSPPHNQSADNTLDILPNHLTDKIVAYLPLDSMHRLGVTNKYFQNFTKPHRIQAALDQAILKPFFEVVTPALPHSFYKDFDEVVFKNKKVTPKQCHQALTAVIGLELNLGEEDLNFLIDRIVQRGASLAPTPFDYPYAPISFLQAFYIPLFFSTVAPPSPEKLTLSQSPLILSIASGKHKILDKLTSLYPEGLSQDYQWAIQDPSMVASVIPSRCNLLEIALQQQSLPCVVTLMKSMQFQAPAVESDEFSRASPGEKALLLELGSPLENVPVRELKTIFKKSAALGLKQTTTNILDRCPELAREDVNRIGNLATLTCLIEKGWSCEIDSRQAQNIFLGALDQEHNLFKRIAGHYIHNTDALFDHSMRRGHLCRSTLHTTKNLEWLLRNYALSNPSKDWLLEWACLYSGRFSCARLILDNHQDINRDLPREFLHFAAKCGSDQSVRVMLAADIMFRDTALLNSAWDLAQESIRDPTRQFRMEAYQNIFKMLGEAGATRCCGAPLPSNCFKSPNL